MTDNKTFALDFASLSHNELELKYNKKYDTLRKCANKLGLSRNCYSGGRPPTKLSCDDLCEKYKAGATITSLGKDMHVSRYVITNYLKRHNLKLRGRNDKGWMRKYNFDENFFERIDTEAKAYILGFVMADGCLYSGKKHNNLLRINIHEKDVEILEIVKREMKSESPIKFLGNNSVDIKLFSKKMFGDLVRHGCGERKSLTLQFPHISDSLKWHFLRGYFDGDGTITFSLRDGKLKCYNLTFYSSHEFCRGLNNILAEIGFPLKKVTIVGNISKLSYTSEKDIRAFYNQLYSGATLWLNRKRNKMAELIGLLDMRKDSTL